MKIIIYSLIAFLLSINIYAGTRDPKIVDSQYINYGSKFNCVVAVCGSEENGQLYCASGVAIRPRWVLTAAHVIKLAKTCRVTLNDKKINVSKIIPHKDFNHDQFGLYDIGLCKTDENLNLDFYPELYENQDEVGKVCSMSGYGITGTFETGPVISDGKRRAGSNKINYIDKHLLICNLEDGYTSMEFLIASGDSGGGLFIDKKLAGINSCVMTVGKAKNSSYGSESGHTRISEHISWIMENIKENEE